MSHNKVIEYTKRILIYIIGLYVLTFGVALSIKSNLGVTPVSTLTYSLQKNIFTDATLGNVTFIYNAILVCMQIVVLRKNYKLFSLIQLPATFLFSMLIDLNVLLLHNTAFESMVIRVVMMLVAILLVGVGLFFVLTPKICPAPPEGFMLALHQVTGRKFSNIKVLFDSTSVIIAATIALIVSKNFGLSGVGVGTVIAALTVGKIIGVIDKIIGNKTNLFIFGEKTEDLLE